MGFAIRHARVAGGREHFAGEAIAGELNNLRCVQRLGFCLQRQFVAATVFSVGFPWALSRDRADIDRVDSVSSYHPGKMDMRLIGSRFICICLAVALLPACAKEPSVPHEPLVPEGKLPSWWASAEPGPKDPDAPAEFTTTSSGLKYRILRKSKGTKRPLASDTVTVHYRGWLDDDTEFDSSYKRKEAIEFSLQNVIPAWTEGCQLIGEGGMIELEVPPVLGYGEKGMPPTIPGNARLHFIIELHQVTWKT